MYLSIYIELEGKAHRTDPIRITLGPNARAPASTKAPACSPHQALTSCISAETSCTYKAVLSYIYLPPTWGRRDSFPLLPRSRAQALPQTHTLVVLWARYKGAYLELSGIWVVKSPGSRSQVIKILGFRFSNRTSKCVTCGLHLGWVRHTCVCRDSYLSKVDPVVR